MPTITARMPELELKEIDFLSKEENKSKSDVLREVLNYGIEKKKIELALSKYRRRDVSISKAAEIAGVSLSKFFDLLKESNVEFNYTVDDLREDFENI